MADEALDTGTASETPDPVQGVKDAALESMVKREDITDYVREREARTKEEAGEQTNGDGRDEDRAERIRRALNEAREATQEAHKQNGLDQPDLDQQYQSAEQEWQQAEQQEQTFEQERERARNEGKFMATAEELKAVNPTAHQEITSALGYLDMAMAPEQTDVLTREITKGNPKESMLVLHRLTQTSYNDDGSVAMTPSDKLSYLASLPPQQLAAVLDQSRTYLQLEGAIAAKLARQYANQPRRHTAAPPPFKRVSGGANPPKDVNALARKSDISDYAKARRAMDKNRDDR